MTFLKIVLMLALFMAFAITALSATPSQESSSVADDDDDDYYHASEVADLHLPPGGSQELLPTYYLRRFLAQNQKPREPAMTMTCNKYPRVCRVAGSPGPDCCKKKCVNVKTDNQNCGMCGKKCKYSQICCKGQCVNPMSNKNHCGGCNNSCNNKKLGSKCLYGMCSYA